MPTPVSGEAALLRTLAVAATLYPEAAHSVTIDTDRRRALVHAVDADAADAWVSGLTPVTGWETSETRTQKALLTVHTGRWGDWRVDVYTTEPVDDPAGLGPYYGPTVEVTRE